jgi:hypothetical protein
MLGEGGYRVVEAVSKPQFQGALAQVIRMTASLTSIL